MQLEASSFSWYWCSTSEVQRDTITDVSSSDAATVMNSDKVMSPHLLLEVCASSCLSLLEAVCINNLCWFWTKLWNPAAFKWFEKGKHRGMQIIQSSCCNLSFHPPHHKCSRPSALLSCSLIILFRKTRAQNGRCQRTCDRKQNKCIVWSTQRACRFALSAGSAAFQPAWLDLRGALLNSYRNKDKCCCCLSHIRGVWNEAVHCAAVRLQVRTGELQLQVKRNQRMALHGLKQCFSNSGVHPIGGGVVRCHGGASDPRECVVFFLAH